MILSPPRSVKPDGTDPRARRAAGTPVTLGATHRVAPFMHRPARRVPHSSRVVLCYVFGTGVKVMSGTTASAPAVTANSVGCESNGSKPSAETVT